MKRKKQGNGKEIMWNVVNSLLAGALVFLGSISDGTFTLQGLAWSATTSLAIAIMKFKQYWESEEKEYKSKMFSFVH